MTGVRRSCRDGLSAHRVAQPAAACPGTQVSEPRERDRQSQPTAAVGASDAPKIVAMATQINMDFAACYTKPPYIATTRSRQMQYTPRHGDVYKYKTRPLDDWGDCKERLATRLLSYSLYKY